LNNLFNGLIEQFHYLNYTQPVGEHLKYLVFPGNRPIAFLSWSSPPWHMGSRDRYIGSSPQIRRKNLHLMTYNSRYLILSWIEICNLASHILARVAHLISADWMAMYGHPVYHLETFVDTECFAGTCYKAGNWVYLGNTTGQGIKEKTKKVTRSKKDVFGYVLGRSFRSRLCDGSGS
jgi:hypothetical protein